MFVVQIAKVWEGELTIDADLFSTDRLAKNRYENLRRYTINQFRAQFGQFCLSKFDPEDPESAKINTPVTFTDTGRTFEIWYREETKYKVVIKIVELKPDVWIGL